MRTKEELELDVKRIHKIVISATRNRNLLVRQLMRKYRPTNGKPTENEIAYIEILCKRVRNAHRQESDAKQAVINYDLDMWIKKWTGKGL